MIINEMNNEQNNHEANDLLAQDSKTYHKLHTHHNYHIYIIFMQMIHIFTVQ